MNKKYFGVHREGWKFFLIFSLLSFFSLTISIVLFLLFIIFSFFTLWFFRDPERASENNDDQLLSAADGKIRISLGGTQTKLIEEGRYVYDVIVSSGNTFYRLVDGNILVQPGISSISAL